jgi:hypothetical protein
MSKFCVMATWSDVPHLSEQAKKELWESIPPYQRDARTKGIPQLGSGAIYPVSESEVLVEPFDIPIWWPRCYALDVGWNRTAAVWGAWERETGIAYIYSEYYKGEAEPATHVHAIKSRGDWIPGVIDPTAKGRSSRDGEQLLYVYQQMGLSLMPANNAVEAGIYDVWLRMTTGRLKVFKTCLNWLDEFRLYRRDESGKVVKESDHLMDCTRYLIVSGLDVATAYPDDDIPAAYAARGSRRTGRDAISGY